MSPKKLPLGRELLSKTGEIRVDVTAVKQLSPTSIAFTFKHEDVQYQDRFTATPEQIDQLLMEAAGKDVFATIKPEDTEGFDPAVVSVEVVGND